MACKTLYDAPTKTWTGPKEEYDTHTPVGETLFNNLRRQGDKVIQIFHDTREEMTASQMYEKSIKIANQLRQLGFQQNDLVTVNCKHVPNSTPLMIALFAIGIRINTVDENNLLRMNGEYSFLRLVKPKFLICHSNDIEAVEEHLKKINHKVVELISMERIIDTAGEKKYKSIEELLASDEEDSEFIPPIIEDTKSTVALILASSGTTGVPKAICLSHAMLLSQVHRCTTITDSGVTYNPSPLDWISGIDSLLGHIVRGKVRVITTYPITPENLIEIIQTHEVTDFFCDPSRMFGIDRILRERQVQFDNMLNLSCGGTLISKDLKKKMEFCFPNAKIAIGYGTTEIAGLATASFLSYKGFSCGFMLRGLSIKIIGQDGERLGLNEVGEIFWRTNHPFLGYYGDGVDPKMGQDEDGWMSTGDMAYFDEEGYLFIVGRKQDILQYMHHRISPIDIESVLEQHDEIIRACVVAVSVPILNDIPAAICVRKEDSNITEEELSKWLEDKIPDIHKLRGGIYFLDALPETPNGKVKKILCKEIAFRLYHENK